MAVDAPAAAIQLCGVPGQSAAHCCRVAQVSGQGAVLWSQKSLMASRVRTKALVPGVRDMGFCLQALFYKPAHQARVCFALSLWDKAPPPSMGGGSLCGCPKPLAVQLGPRSISTQGPVSLLPAPPPQLLPLALGNTNPVRYQPLVQGRVGLEESDQSADLAECRWRVLGACPLGPSGCTASGVCDYVDGTDLTSCLSPPDSCLLQGNGGDEFLSSSVCVCACTCAHVHVCAGLPVWQRT